MGEPVDGTTLRRVMRRVPSPVVVVTASGAGKTRGITIGSMASVALEPPLLSFNVNRSARMHEVMAAAEHFAVNVVTGEQVMLCRRFARPDLTGEEQFATVPHRTDEHDAPLLDDVAAILRCRPHARFEAGDHTVFVGEVVHANVHRDEAGAVVYYRHDYRRVSVDPSKAHSPVKRSSSVTS